MSARAEESGFELQCLESVLNVRQRLSCLVRNQEVNASDVVLLVQSRDVNAPGVVARPRPCCLA